MCVPPKFLRKGDWIDTCLFPPIDFVTGSMHFAVVSSAQGDNKFVAYFAPERPRLREPKMVRIRRLAAAYQARAFGYPFDVHFIAEPSGFWEATARFCRRPSACAAAELCPASAVAGCSGFRKGSDFTGIAVFIFQAGNLGSKRIFDEAGVHCAQAILRPLGS